MVRAACVQQLDARTPGKRPLIPTVRSTVETRPAALGGPKRTNLGS
jgi:hypothetical protein